MHGSYGNGTGRLLRNCHILLRVKWPMPMLHVVNLAELPEGLKVTSKEFAGGYVSRYKPFMAFQLQA